MIKAKSALGNVGFSICRLSNADYVQLMDSVKALNNPTIKNIVKAVLNVDGKEFTREVVAPHQDVFDNYALGR